MRAGTGLARPAAAAVALVAVLLAQLTIVNGVPLPRGGAPDLVLLTVIALGLVSGPRVGLASGFLAGLALDLAPPASDLVGQYALVFCVAGYVSGRMSGLLRRSALLAICCAVVVAATAEAMSAGLTVALDTPEVSVATVARALPATLAYDVVLTPLILIVVVRVAAMLGAQVSEVATAPAGEPGGSASAAASGAPGLRVPAPAHGVARPSGRGRHAAGRGSVGGGIVPTGDSGGPWLIGDGAAGAIHVGSVGWLSGPATSRRARRKQAKLTAMLTGAKPRKGNFWVSARPPGLAAPTPPATVPPAKRARMRPSAGVPGSAAQAALAGWPAGAPGVAPAGSARPAGSSRPSGSARHIHFGRTDDPQRHKRRPVQAGPNGSGDWHGADRHALLAPGVPRIAFGSGVRALPP